MKEYRTWLKFIAELILEKTIREGLLLAFPIILVGAGALMLRSVPLPGYQAFVRSALEGHLYYILSTLHMYTVGILPLMLIFTMSFSFGRAVAAERKEILYYPLTAFISYLIVFVPRGSWSLIDAFGATQTFTSIVITVFSCLLFYGLRRWKLLQLKNMLPSYDPTFDTVFQMIFPAAIVLFCSSVAAVLAGPIVQGDVADLHVRFFEWLGYGAPGAFMYALLEHVYWFIGIHGSNILNAVSVNFFEPHLLQNAGLAAQGLPPTQIYTKTFFDAFVIMGGSGSVLSLLVAIFLFARHSNTLRIAKLSLLPCLFNISEVVLIGLPVICNGVFFLPFLLVPLFSLFASSLAMQCGLVPIPSQAVEWTTPALLNGYLATGSLSGSLLQLFTLVCGVLIYRPFVLRYEAAEEEKLKHAFNHLVAEVITCEESGKAPELMKHPEFSSIAKILASDLRQALRKKELQLFYQPQVNFDGSIYGGEALLRWKHPQFGFIYPPLIIFLAHENKLLDELGLFLIDRAGNDLEYLTKNLLYPVKISVNVSPLQLYNAHFCDQVRALLDKYDFGASIMAFELTEQIALSGAFDIKERLRELKRMGILLSMDDFGMGHSSVMYLQDSDFDIVKLDGALTKKVLSSDRSVDIIQAITQLSEKFNFKVVAEFVETEAQRDRLAALGCTIYQGWFYSPAVTLSEFINYLQKAGRRKKGGDRG